MLFKRAAPVAKGAKAEPGQKGGITVADGFQKLVQAIGKRLGWTPAEVENITSEVAKEGATTFAQQIAEEDAERKYRPVTEELWDLIWTLEDALSDTIRDETADRATLILQSVDEFKARIATSLPSWLLGSATIAKVGRKIAADRLQRMKDAYQVLGDVITEAEQDAQTTDTTTTTKNDSKGVDKLPETKIDKAALPEDVRKYLEELEQKAQDLEKSGGKVPEEITKQLNDLKKRADQAEADLRKERDERLTKDYVAKAGELKNFGVNPQELGPALKSLAEKDPENYAKVEAALKAADEAAGKAGLFKEAGTSAAAAGGTAMAKIEGAAAELRKTDPNLTQAQAITKALDLHPELYDEYGRETSK
jgi:hypothetical protein